MRIDRKELASKLKAVKSAIPKPKDQGVLGVMYDNGTLIADNYSMRIEAKLDIQQSLTEDKFILPVKAIELIENLSSPDIEITYTPTTVKIKSGSSQTSFAALRIDDFPVSPELTEENRITLDADDFCNKISKTLFACAYQGLYSGVLIKDTYGGIDLVGCDGSRLAKNHISGDLKFDVVIPKDCIKKVMQLGIQGSLSLVQSKNKILFESEDYKIYSQLLSGEYMDYGKILNAKSMGFKATVDRNKFAEIIKRVCLLSDRTAMTIKRKDDHTLQIAVSNATVDFVEEIEYAGELSEGLVVGFNSTFMENAIHEFDSDEITLLIDSATLPCSIIEGDFHTLVLPVRLKKAQAKNNA